ncbi:hypothetical protein AOQ84DRAFT_228549 [Glonium stellatum]|uniref:Uncharacterized protein n=1 Tax=Glonium stellatum TaxID=574774 RepID=A0A8E2F7L9_9PEZI|nr:hypothetical protein AOQ84DRAFT_228549 [Glonium stellatum]
MRRPASSGQRHSVACGGRSSTAEGDMGIRPRPGRWRSAGVLWRSLALSGWQAITKIAASALEGGAHEMRKKGDGGAETDEIDLAYLNIRPVLLIALAATLGKCERAMLRECKHVVSGKDKRQKRSWAVVLNRVSSGDRRELLHSATGPTGPTSKALACVFRGATVAGEMLCFFAMLFCYAAGRALAAAMARAMQRQSAAVTPKAHGSEYRKRARAVGARGPERERAVQWPTVGLALGLALACAEGSLCHLALTVSVPSSDAQARQPGILAAHHRPPPPTTARHAHLPRHGACGLPAGFLLLDKSEAGLFPFPPFPLPFFFSRALLVLSCAPGQPAVFRAPSAVSLFALPPTAPSPAHPPAHPRLTDFGGLAGRHTLLNSAHVYPLASHSLKIAVTLGKPAIRTPTPASNSSLPSSLAIGFPSLPPTHAWPQPLLPLAGTGTGTGTVHRPSPIACFPVSAQ